MKDVFLLYCADCTAATDCSRMIGGSSLIACVLFIVQWQAHSTACWCLVCYESVSPHRQYESGAHSSNELSLTS